LELLVDTGYYYFNMYCCKILEFYQYCLCLLDECIGYNYMSYSINYGECANKFKIQNEKYQKQWCWLSFYTSNRFSRWRIWSFISSHL